VHRIKVVFADDEQYASQVGKSDVDGDNFGRLY
jgi:hypothetical protein